MSRFANTLRNALKPRYAKVMVGKVRHRMSAEERTRREATQWAAEHRVNPQQWCARVDPDLWAEAQQFRTELRERAEVVRAETGSQLGGGARAALLYFVTRLTRPEVVVETGVAYGYSSFAFLRAMERNGTGRLYSSDFPYFREENPEKLVGIIVPPELRERWVLLLEGDQHNLPKILEQIDRIDLLHYDSDKSYSGRQFGMDLLVPRLAPNAVLMMDDITDNVFFRDFAATRKDPFIVFGRSEYCVGAFGLPAAPA